jgi:hypothetical protein
MNIDLDNIKTEFSDYKEKQRYFEMVYNKQHKGKVVTKSKEKLVDGSYKGVTYVKSKKQ